MKKSLHVNHLLMIMASQQNHIQSSWKALKKLHIPKHIGFKDCSEPDKVKLSKGLEIDITFKGSLRINNSRVLWIVVRMVHIRLKPFMGGIISVPCGWGKTIMALYLISALKRKTIVIVHKEFLLNQWIKSVLKNFFQKHALALYKHPR